MKSKKNYKKAWITGALSAIILATGSFVFAESSISDFKVFNVTSIHQLEKFGLGKVFNASEKDTAREFMVADSVFSEHNNPMDIEGLSAITADNARSYGSKFEDPYKGVISQKEIETLSMEQIDVRLKNAGKETIGDIKNPLYKLKPSEIKNITDDEWKEINEYFLKSLKKENFGFKIGDPFEKLESFKKK